MNPLSPPTFPSLIKLGGEGEFAGALLAGLELAFPGAPVASVATLEEVEKTAGPGEALLLLFRPTQAEVAAASSRLDAVGLTRWGVVIFGDHEQQPDDEIVTVRRASESPREVARSLRLALALHRLRRDNQRFRGDLATIGIRFAHDLRSPLGGVSTTMEVLREMLAEELPTAVALLEPMRESSEELGRLIRQLSLLTKAAAGGVRRESFDLRLPFWAAFQRIEREALRRGATLVQPPGWPEVMGDPAWAEAMWHALLANSLQHAGAAPHIEAGWTRTGDEVRCWIVDSGEVAVGKRDFLFQPFHLRHLPSAPRGFGLAIVQRLAELQGGKCGYEPVPAGGSCFFFTFPAGGNAPAAATL